MEQNLLYGSLGLQNRQPKDYGSAKAYADAVKTWYLSSFQWLQTQHDQYLATHNINQTNSPQITFQNVPNPQGNRPMVHRVLQPVARLQRSQTIIIHRCEVAPFGQRLLAEMIDFLLLLFVKIIVVYTLLELDIIETQYLAKIFKDTSDFSSLIELTRGLFPVELLSKLLCSLLEAWCISFGLYSTPSGTTPGKYWMGLEVVQYVDLQQVSPPVLHCLNIARHQQVSFKNSLVRSLIKNLVTNFFFPINAFCYMFNHNQAIYDCIAKTLVIRRTAFRPM